MAESIQKKTHGDCELRVRKKVGKIDGSEYRYGFIMRYSDS